MSSPNDAGAANAAKAKGSPVTFGHEAVTDHTNYLGMAGLLAARPELRTASLSEADWQSALGEYLTSERI